MSPLSIVGPGSGKQETVVVVIYYEWARNCLPLFLLTKCCGHRWWALPGEVEGASHPRHLDGHPSIKWPVAFVVQSTASSFSFVSASHLNQCPFFNQSTRRTWRHDDKDDDVVPALHAQTHKAKKLQMFPLCHLCHLKEWHFLSVVVTSQSLSPLCVGTLTVLQVIYWLVVGRSDRTFELEHLRNEPPFWVSPNNR